MAIEYPDIITGIKHRLAYKLLLKRGFGRRIYKMSIYECIMVARGKWSVLSI